MHLAELQKSSNASQFKSKKDVALVHAWICSLGAIGGGLDDWQ